MLDVESDEDAAMGKCQALNLASTRPNLIEVSPSTRTARKGQHDLAPHELRCAFWSLHKRDAALLLLQCSLPRMQVAQSYHINKMRFSECNQAAGNGGLKLEPCCCRNGMEQCER